MRYLMLATVLLAAVPADAATLLHPMFADHAVLQRGQPIPVYGTAKPGADVTLQLGNATASARADKDGQWRATLPAMTAGGPFVLHAASGSDSQDVRDVLVGDVFLCTGQSNMQVSVRGAANAAAEIAAATDDRSARAGSGPRAQSRGADDLQDAGIVESGIAPDGRRFLGQLFLFRARIAQAREDAGRADHRGLGRHQGKRLGQPSQPAPARLQ